MDWEELKEIYFGADFSKKYSELRDKIIETVRNCSDEFTFDYSGIQTEDLITKKHNPSYELPNLLQVTENGIVAGFNSKELGEIIKKHLNKNVKKIGLPSKFITENIEYLSTLKNLTELTITDYSSLTMELLEELYQKTSVKKIYVDGKYNIPYKGNLDYAVENTTRVAVYKDISIIPLDTDKITDSIEIISSDIDNDKIKKVYELLELPKDLSKISISREMFDDNYVIKFREDGIKITVADSTLKNIQPLYEYFVSKGYKVSELSIKIKDTKDMYSYDYSFLDKIENQIKIVIDNGHVGDITYEEFRSQIEGIKWFKQIISQSDLSPLEKLLFAYDIMKTFTYKEKEQYSASSRNPGKILNSDYIVCSGYTAMLDEILKEIDPNIKHASVGVSCYDEEGKYRGGHSRSIVDLDDDKYGIHGSFFLDATWDSGKESRKEYYGDDYNALDLYRYFLVPFSDYKKVFKYDSNPQMFTSEELNETFTLDVMSKEIERIKEEVREDEEKNKGNKFAIKINPIKELIGYSALPIFVGKTLDQIFTHFKSSRIRFDILLSAIKAVRLAEGYTQENVDKDIARVSRINAKYYEDGHEIHLEDTKKRD